MCVSVFPVYVCVHNMYVVPDDDRCLILSNLVATVSLHVGSGNQTWVFWKNKCSYPQNHLSSPGINGFCLFLFFEVTSELFLKYTLNS